MLSEFQKRKIGNLFAVHDLNHDGVLEKSDYLVYAQRLGAKRGLGPGSTEYDDLVGKFLGFWEMLRDIADRNNDRQVTLREWFACFDQLLSSPHAIDRMRPIGEAVFTMLDRNSDGVVTLDEYRWLYSSGALDPNLAAASFERLDTNHDGKITTQELSERLLEFFASEDQEAPGTWLFGPLVPDPRAAAGMR